MSAVISMPRVKLNREKFLTRMLKPYCDDKHLSIALKGMPVNVVSMQTVDKLASACIKRHVMEVTSLSAITGFGGFTTIPTDVVQYFWHLFVLSQKLAYLYGFPDLCDEEGEMSMEAQNLLTLFVGIMLGATMAGKGVQYVIEQIAKQTTRRLPEVAMAKTLYLTIVRQVEKRIAEKLSKSAFSKGLEKSLPLIGCLLSGVITFTTFRPGASRLRKELKREMILLQNEELNYIPHERER